MNPKRLSPRAMSIYALLFATLFGLARLAGLSEQMGFLSGTIDQTSIALGVLYLVLHFLFVLLAPILIIATAIFTLLLLPGLNMAAVSQEQSERDCQ